MRRIYASIAERQTARAAIDELLHDGVEAQHIQLFSPDPQGLGTLPVRVSRLRRPRQVMWRAPRAVGAAAGVAIVVILTLLAGPTGGAPALVIVLLSALIGGFVARQTLAGGADRAALAVIRGQGGLKSDKTVLLVDVQDDRAQEVERKLKQAHPEVAVLGTDPAESPPFP
jgi:hypothetical protein